MCIITHIIGFDFDISLIEKHKKQHTHLIVLEDRCQGGSLQKPFSSDCVDIALYSTGMDKRPIALGGGFAIFRAGNDDRKGAAPRAKQRLVLSKLYKQVCADLDSLPVERCSSRILDICSKLPTYFIYNCRPFLCVRLHTLTFCKTHFGFPGLCDLAFRYRKTNPGFSHDGFMLRPSNGLLISMKTHMSSYESIESLIIIVFSEFTSAMGNDIARLFMPWYQGQVSLSIYNAVFVHPHLVCVFVLFMEERGVTCMKNPTYDSSMLPCSSPVGKLLIEGYVLLPYLSAMRISEVKRLAGYLKEFASKHICHDQHSFLSSLNWKNTIEE